MYPDISPRKHLMPVASGMQDHAMRGGGLRGLLRAVTRHWQRRKMIATFEAMDDWVLDDIGLRREDIVRVVDSFDEMRRPKRALPEPDQMRSKKDVGRHDMAAHDMRRAA